MLRYFYKGLAAAMIAIILMVMIAVPVSAADVRSGGTINVAVGEVVDDDLYVAGTTITINGMINGDLIAAGGTVTVNGVVNGSVMAACGTLDINGKVTGSVRCAGGTISVSGEVNKDLVIGGGELHMTGTAKVGRDILLGAGSAIINGTILGDMDAIINKLTLASSADIKGKLTYTSNKEVVKEPGAKIGGAVTHNLPKKANPFIGWVISFVMMLVTGMVVILLFPGRTTAIIDSIRTKPWPSLGWGALILFTIPIAVIVLLVTIIGVPLGLIAAVLYGIAVLLGQIPIAVFLGRWILGHLKQGKGRALLIAAYAIGLAILSLLILIPYAGFIIWLVAVLLGLGGLLISIKETRKVTI